MNFKPVIRFIVTSDIHTKTTQETEILNFEKGMKFAYDYASSCEYKNVDAYFSVGDFANSGTEGEMLRYKKALDRVIDKNTKQCLMLATHEFHSGDGEKGAIERLDRIFGQKPDNAFKVNGFTFICISVGEHCYINEEKQKWLKSQLEKAHNEDPYKPIFVFQHPHLTNTVYGSINWGEDDIISILTDYPQVVDFSGHSHAPINDPRSVYQKYFSCFGTGSFHYIELDEYDFMYGTVPPDAHNVAQFLIAEVDKDNRVRIIPVDALTGHFFNDGWLVEKPSEPDSYIYTEERAFKASKPYFPDNTQCDIRFSEGRLYITFTQAKQDDDRVNTYSVVIRRAEDSVIVRQKKIASSYYLYNMPEKVSLDFDFVQGNYILEITANGFWHNKSEKYVKRFSV